MGAWETLVDYTVPSNTTSVTFNSFGTITKDDFIKIHMTNVNGNNTGGSILLLANSSINSNYHRQFLFANGSSISAGRENKSVFAQASSGLTDNNFAYLKISENNRLNYFVNRTFRNDSGLLTYFDYITSSGATFTSGITSLTFTAENTNGIGANSRIQIYRLAAEKVADIVVNANTTQVDITGLDIKKGDEYLLVSDWFNSGSTSAIALTPNDLTTRTQYYNQRIVAFDSSSVAGRVNDNYLTEAFGSTWSQTYTHIKISNIGAFTFQSYSLLGAGTSSIGIFNYFNSSTYENLTNATKLNIFDVNSSTRIGTGSRFQLYKLYEGGN